MLTMIFDLLTSFSGRERNVPVEVSEKNFASRETLPASPRFTSCVDVQACVYIRTIIIDGRSFSCPLNFVRHYTIYRENRLVFASYNKFDPSSDVLNVLKHLHRVSRNRVPIRRTHKV